MLGEIVTDLRRILSYTNWPGSILEPDSGSTTHIAAGKLERELRAEAALANAPLMTWLGKLNKVTEARDRVVHAIALHQCMNCGNASMFRHPRSGDEVDRSPMAVGPSRLRTTTSEPRDSPLQRT